MSRIDLSLILALYNEEPIIKESLNEVKLILDNIKIDYEVILVDDCSKDNTIKIVNDFIKNYDNFILIKQDKNQGRGQTLKDGFKKAQGEVIGYIDVDLEVSPIYIPLFYHKIINGQADLITGHRIYKFSLKSILRYSTSKGYHFLVRSVLGLNLKDTETGYKFFKKDKLFSILDKTEDQHWFWDTEIMFYSQYYKFKIIEYPVLFIRRHDKKSSLKLFKDSCDYFKKLYKFRKKVKKIIK